MCHNSPAEMTSRLGFRHDASYANLYIKKWLFETGRIPRVNYW